MSKKTRKAREQENQSVQSSQTTSSGDSSSLHLSKYARKKQMQALEALRAKQAEEQEQSRPAKKASSHKAKPASNESRTIKSSAKNVRAANVAALADVDASADRSVATAQSALSAVNDHAPSGAKTSSNTPERNNQNGPSRLFTLIRKPIAMINNRTDMRTSALRQLKQERQQGIVISSERTLGAVIAEQDGDRPEGNNGGTLSLRRNISPRSGRQRSTLANPYNSHSDSNVRRDDFKKDRFTGWSRSSANAYARNSQSADPNTGWTKDAIEQYARRGYVEPGFGSGDTSSVFNSYSINNFGRNKAFGGNFGNGKGRLINRGSSYGQGGSNTFDRPMNLQDDNERSTELSAIVASSQAPKTESTKASRSNANISSKAITQEANAAVTSKTSVSTNTATSNASALSVASNSGGSSASSTASASGVTSTSGVASGVTSVSDTASASGTKQDLSVAATKTATNVSATQVSNTVGAQEANAIAQTSKTSEGTKSANTDSKASVKANLQEGTLKLKRGLTTSSSFNDYQGHGQPLNASAEVSSSEIVDESYDNELNDQALEQEYFSDTNSVQDFYHQQQENKNVAIGSSAALSQSAAYNAAQASAISADKNNLKDSKPSSSQRLNSSQRRRNAKGAQIKPARPLKGRDSFVKFFEHWRQKMDPSDLWTNALNHVCFTRKFENGNAYLGVPAFLKFLEGKTKRQIVDEYAFEFKLFLRRFEITNFIDGMRYYSDRWWNNRPRMESSYAIIYFDCHPVRFRGVDKAIRTEQVLMMLGVTMNGQTDLLSCMPGFKTKNLNIEYWSTILQYFKNRGVQNICYIVANFNCRYLERALGREFPQTTLQWNLMDVLNFNSFALPDFQRKFFMQDAQALCESPDFNIALERLHAMQDKWQPQMVDTEHFPNGVLDGNEDLLERYTSMPLSMRPIMSTQKVVGNACTILFGPKRTDDHFSDYEEMLTYLFFRYILLARHIWGQNIGDTVCNLNFKQVFTKLRTLQCSGSKLLDALLRARQQHFFEKYFGSFGPGPVLSYQGRHGRLTVRLESSVKVEDNIWNERELLTPQLPDTQTLSGHLTNSQLENVAQIESVPQLNRPELNDASKVAAMVDASDALNEGEAELSSEFTHLDERDKYISTSLSTPAYQHARPDFCLALPNTASDPDGHMNFSDLDEELLQQATTPEVFINPPKYEHYQPVNAVPGMLRPSIAMALKREIEFLRYRQRRYTLYWINNDRFNFEQIEGLKHTIAPVFKVAVKNRKEFLERERKAEDKIKLHQRALREHTNYLKRHGLKLNPAAIKSQGMREMALPLARHEQFEEMRELKLLGASAEEIKKLQERQQLELKQWLSVNQGQQATESVDPQEALQAIAKAAQSHASSCTPSASLKDAQGAKSNAVPVTLTEQANNTDQTAKTESISQDAAFVKLKDSAQLNVDAPNNRQSAQLSQKLSQDQKAADSTNNLLDAAAQLTQEQHDADLNNQPQRTLVLRKRTVVVPHMPIEPATTPAGKKILSLRRKNGVKGGAIGNMNPKAQSTAEN